MRLHLELFVTIDNRAFVRRTIGQVVIVATVCIRATVHIVNRNRVGRGDDSGRGRGDGDIGGGGGGRYSHTGCTAQWGARLLLHGIDIVFGKTRRNFKAAVFLPVRPASVTQSTIQMSWTPCVPLRMRMRKWL